MVILVLLNHLLFHIVDRFTVKYLIYVSSYRVGYLFTRFSLRYFHIQDKVCFFGSVFCGLVIRVIIGYLYDV